MKYIVTLPPTYDDSPDGTEPVESWMSYVLSAGLKTSVQVCPVYPGSDLDRAIDDRVDLT